MKPPGGNAPATPALDRASPPPPEPSPAARGPEPAAAGTVRFPARWFPEAQSGWSWERTARVILLIFVGQLFILIALSRKLPGTGGSAPRTTPAPLRWDEGAPTPAAGDLPDAATLAVVNPGGFSGPVWDRGASSLIAGPTPGMAGASRLPGRLDPIPAGNALSPAAPAGDPPPGTTTFLKPDSRVPLSAATVLTGGTKVRLRLGGAGLLLEPSTPWRVWTNAEVLAPTQVGVLIDADGGILSASLVLPGSGLAAADQEALKEARRVRLDPLRTPDAPHSVRWGELEFLWQTVAPPPGTPAPPRP